MCHSLGVAAPEAVAMSRRLGRDLVPADLRRGYALATRLFVDWDELVAHAAHRFDGVHPVKIKDSLDLEPYLRAVVVHRAEAAELGKLPGWAQQRLVVLDTDVSTPAEWASAALVAAEQEG